MFAVVSLRRCVCEKVRDFCRLIQTDTRLSFPIGCFFFENNWVHPSYEFLSKDLSTRDVFVCFHIFSIICLVFSHSFLVCFGFLLIEIIHSHKSVFTMAAHLNLFRFGWFGLHSSVFCLVCVQVLFTCIFFFCS